MRTIEKCNSGVLLFVAILTISVTCGCRTNHKLEYSPTFESLSSHSVPQWFSDSKFGIFIHWGVYSVPALHEWYVDLISPRSNWGQPPQGPPYTAEQGDLPDSMFRKTVRMDANQFHRDNYGADFEYDQFIPMFKAENFNPETWADLFVQAGARYVVMTARHGDEFSLWPTKYSRRNALDMGPHRDLAGDLLRSVRNRGLKMGFYHNTTYSFWDKRFPGPEWVTYMNNSIKELIDLYHPDILWGDVVVCPVNGSDGKPFSADHFNSKDIISYFYNNSPDPAEVVTNDRWGIDTTLQGIDSERSFSKSLWADYSKEWNVAQGAILGDYQTPERRNINKIFNRPWETCDALDPTSWGYNRLTPDDKYMTVNELVDYLSDIVSKGGNLLINIGPRSDGTIPEVMQDRLRGVGAWLKINGEAIYGTRPWKIYGEGPTTKEIGSWTNQDDEYKFSSGDIRFTLKKDILYAILLEWPGAEVSIKSLSGLNIRKISMLGSDDNLEWRQEGDAITVSLPPEPVSPCANTLKIEYENNGR